MKLDVLELFKKLVIATQTRNKENLLMLKTLNSVRESITKIEELYSNESKKDLNDQLSDLLQYLQKIKTDISNIENETLSQSLLKPYNNVFSKLYLIPYDYYAKMLFPVLENKHLTAAQHYFNEDPFSCRPQKMSKRLSADKPEEGDFKDLKASHEAKRLAELPLTSSSYQIN